MLLLPVLVLVAWSATAKHDAMLAVLDIAGTVRVLNRQREAFA